MPDAAHQLRLFPAPQPLVERLGAEFFHGIPQSPGVYRMSDADGNLIYVGKAVDLRARLNSYRRTRGQSRKTIRLIHTARSIVWEVCASDAAARLRENELLREHRPRFNRAGTWPVGWYVTVETPPNALQLRLVREPVPGCHGAFRGGVQSALLALTQLLWLALHETTDPGRLPFSLGATRESRELQVEHPGSPSWADALNAFLSGESDAVLQRVTRSPESLATSFERAFHEAQATVLTEFYARGPQRNRYLRQLFRAESPWLDPTDLDDLPLRLPPPLGADSR